MASVERFGGKCRLMFMCIRKKFFDAAINRKIISTNTSTAMAGQVGCVALPH